MRKALCLLGALGSVALTAGCVQDAQYPGYSSAYSNGYGTTYSPQYSTAYSPGYSTGYGTPYSPQYGTATARGTRPATPRLQQPALRLHAGLLRRRPTRRPSTPRRPRAARGTGIRRGVDADRDGVPNRYDRDANGDGVPDRYRGPSQRLLVSSTGGTAAAPGAAAVPSGLFLPASCSSRRSTIRISRRSISSTRAPSRGG
jgi:hypothetical protein